MHNCPRCGQPTNGAWSEGGLLWAICDDCMSADSSAVEEVRPTMRAVDDCPRCGGRGEIRNDGFVWVACPACSGNRH